MFCDLTNEWDSILNTEHRRTEVTLIADAVTDTSDAHRAIAATGGFLKNSLDPSNALSWFDAGQRQDLILVEVERPSDAMEKLLHRADHVATLHNIPLCISTGQSSLDFVTSAAAGPNTSWLCEPDLADRVSAIATYMADGQAVLRDVASDLDTQRLRRLADEVSRIARALSSLSSTEPSGGRLAASAMSDVQLNFRSEPMNFGAEIPMPSAEDIRRILRVRRMRDQYFDSSLFADPAWDMLLDLLAAGLEETQVAVSSLCIAASVPPTTALRWIKAMTDHGLFERCADPDDGRRIFIRLAPSAVNGMARYFDAANKAGGMII
jgi:DNA-binding MarR family transcriptional regulator